MNKVLLIGNLTRDPELTQTNNGIAVCKFSIAVNRTFSNANGEKEVDYFNIVAWRALAETCSQYLRKGNKVGISGSIQTRSYEQDGVKKYATDIIADAVDFLTPKTDTAATAPANGSKTPPKKEYYKNHDDEELPF